MEKSDKEVLDELNKRVAQKDLLQREFLALHGYTLDQVLADKKLFDEMEQFCKEKENEI